MNSPVPMNHEANGTRMSESNSAATSLMYTTEDVAQLLKCSPRHVTNLRKGGRMPPPVKLGVLTRWPRPVIDDWIAAGCPPAARRSA